MVSTGPGQVTSVVEDESFRCGDVKEQSSGSVLTRPGPVANYSVWTSPVGLRGDL